MRRTATFCLTLLVLASTALAQNAPSSAPASDQWKAKPAPASSVGGARDQRSGDEQAPSHFRFKERSPYAPPSPNAAQERSGKAPVMGGMNTDSGGRPTVSCASTPHDPSCR